ncbi:hypothetical protein C8R43DRAFT_557042 [Mycena crocata]|nr:hypothetical protein C8R43DRAFT_557042 [Mycena crocata]
MQHCWNQSKAKKLANFYIKGCAYNPSCLPSSSTMALLLLPPELRALIYDFCFPPSQTNVQIIPYHTSAPACRLNLPLALYLVCKLISSELEPVPTKLRRLDLTYIIRGPVLGPGWRPEYGSKTDDDPDHFPLIMHFAERVRLVGSGPTFSRGRSLSSPVRILRPGPECALKILEVQPLRWRKWAVARIMLSNLAPVTTHPDVAERLQVRLIRDTVDPLEDVEDLKARLREYQARKEKKGGGGPTRVYLYDLEGPAREVETNIRKIEKWLKRFEAMRGDDMVYRSQKNGPLGGSSEEDDSE